MLLLDACHLLVVYEVEQEEEANLFAKLLQDFERSLICSFLEDIEDLFLVFERLYDVGDIFELAFLAGGDV